ncbi:MAG: lactate utilization protein [Nitrospira sp.]|nr:lactate utilization protein [Nitrospira sp.]
MDHSTKAAQFIHNEARAHWHDQALWYMRAKRDKVAHGVPEWETLREIAAQIKAHTLSRLPYYLEMFEENARRLGAKVHWAYQAEEHNQIVYEILRDRGIQRVVKSKSMLTEECHLNPFLESRGIEVVDTDLGERIVQLAKEPPSHIVVPAIHKKKEEIGELFHQHLNTEKGASDPIYLTEAARDHLREKFLKAQAGITGVNFAIAETGGLVICTNEGNADMGTALPPLHIACMGFEKLIPRSQDLGIFLRLLARSATGQPITTYSSHFHGPRAGSELHIVIVDNGRSQILQKQEFKRSLSCIRCGACLNTCPVYRRSGGHSYGFTVPGPIGSVLAPARNPKEHFSLPFASSLCGSCTDICPVKIDLHHQLLAWRRELAEQGLVPISKRMIMKISGWIFRYSWVYQVAGKLVRWILPTLPRSILYHKWNAWGRQRELPPFPKESFREMYKKRRSQKPEARSQN